MAWQTGAGKHQYRKEASAAKRASERRQAVEEPVARRSTKRRPSCGARPFGIEYRVLTFSGVWRDWRRWGWYETAAQRDEALKAFAKNKAGIGYEGRPVER